MRSYKWVFTFLLLVPLFILVWQLVHHQLGAQPSEKMNHELGELAFRMLVLNLIWGRLIHRVQFFRKWSPLRRQLGVVTFVYALLHFAFYILKEGDVSVALSQIPQKLYLVIATCALTLLGVLALTSNNFSVRKLKLRWKPLHRLAYLALVLATVHFALIEKKDWTITLPFLIPWLALAVWDFISFRRKAVTSI